MPIADHEVKHLSISEELQNCADTPISGKSMVNDESICSNQIHKYQSLPQSSYEDVERSRYSMLKNVCLVNFNQLQSVANSALNLKCANVNIGYIKNSSLQFFLRQRQLIIPFIWGILVGVALATLFFQQSLLYSYSISWHLNTPHIVLPNINIVNFDKQLESLDVNFPLADDVVDLDQDLHNHIRTAKTDKHTVRMLLKIIEGSVSLYVGY